MVVRRETCINLIPWRQLVCQHNFAPKLPDEVCFFVMNWALVEMFWRLPFCMFNLNPVDPFLLVFPCFWPCIAKIPEYNIKRNVFTTSLRLSLLCFTKIIFPRKSSHKKGYISRGKKFGTYVILADQLGRSQNFYIINSTNLTYYLFAVIPNGPVTSKKQGLLSMYFLSNEHVSIKWKTLPMSHQWCF